MHWLFIYEHNDTKASVETDLMCLLGFNLTRDFYSHIHLLEELTATKVDMGIESQVSYIENGDFRVPTLPRFYFVGRKYAYRVSPNLPLFVKYQYEIYDNKFFHCQPLPPSYGKVEIVEIRKYSLFQHYKDQENNRRIRPKE